MDIKDLKSEQINELAAALSKAQAEIKGAAKDSNNPFFKSKYADLSSVVEAAKPITKYGLAVTQTTQLTDKGTVLVTTLMHSSGQWICGVMPIRPPKDDLQGVGSALTYCRRYAYAAIVGIAPEDDDGESAMARQSQTTVKTSQNTIPKPTPTPTQGSVRYRQHKDDMPDNLDIPF